MAVKKKIKKTTTVVGSDGKERQAETSGKSSSGKSSSVPSAAVSMNYQNSGNWNDPATVASTGQIAKDTPDMDLVLATVGAMGIGLVAPSSGGESLVDWAQNALDSQKVRQEYDTTTNIWKTVLQVETTSGVSVGEFDISQLTNDQQKALTTYYQNNKDKILDLGLGPLTPEAAANASLARQQDAHFNTTSFSVTSSKTASKYKGGGSGGGGGGSGMGGGSFFMPNMTGEDDELIYLYIPGYGSFYFDGVIKVEHNLSVSISDDAENVKEGYVNQAKDAPDEVNIEFYVSDAYTKRRGLVASDGHFKTVLSLLDSAKTARQFCQVISNLHTYSRMLIKSVTAIQDETSVFGWQGSISLHEIINEPKKEATQSSPKTSAVQDDGSKSSDSSKLTSALSWESTNNAYNQKNAAAGGGR